MTNFVVEREGVLQFRRWSFVGIAINGTQGCLLVNIFCLDGSRRGRAVPGFTP